MKHSLLIPCAMSIVLASGGAGQTDIGSAGNNGSVTSNAPGPRVNSERLANTVKEQLHEFQNYTNQTKGGMQLSEEECNSIVNVYKDLQASGHSLVPFEFLSRVIAILPLRTAAKVPDKYAEVIQQALNSARLKRPQMFSEMIVQPATSSEPITEQYKQNLKAAKKQLSSALK